MSLAALEDAIPPGDRLLLDASTLIAATGLVARARHLVTADRGWARLQPIEHRAQVCFLGNYLSFPG